MPLRNLSNMKIPAFFLLVGLSIHLSAQITFNQEFNHGHAAYNLASVYPTDSCYYVMGTVADTLPTNNVGIFFSKLNLQGIAEMTTYLFDDHTIYGCYRGNLLPAPDGTLWNSGYAVDSTGRYGFGIQYNTNGDTLKTVRFRSPHFEENQLLAPSDFKLTADYELLFISSIANQEFHNHRYFIKLDTLGNVLADRIINAPDYSVFKGSIVEKNNDYYIIASKSNFDVATQNYFEQKYLLQLDSNANTINEVLHPSSPEIGFLENAANYLINTSDNNFIGVGIKAYEFSINPGAGGTTGEPFLMKFNSDLNIIWKKEIIIDSTEYGNSFITRVVEAPDSSGYVGAGRMKRPEPGINGGLYKVSPEGDSLWTRYFSFMNGYPTNHDFTDIEVTPDGGYILAGSFTVPLVSFPNPNQRGWVVKVDEHGCLVPGCHIPPPIIPIEEEPIREVISTETEQVSKASIYLKIHPNPASASAYFYTTNIATLDAPKVLIHNLQGQLVKEFEVPSSNTTYILQTGDFPSGIYSVSLMDKGQVIDNQQLLIQH